MVDQVLGVFCSQDDRRPENEPVDPKTATTLRLVDQIKEVRKEEKERKEWAERKVIQAAEKLNDHLIELRQLRMEGLKNQQHKLETEEVKKRTETEDTLRKFSFQADLAEASVLWLEEENAKIEAELEAFKLNASESDRLCLESRMKKRKLLKNIIALEKQNNKLHEEIAEEETETLQLQQQLICLRKAQQDIEVRWRQELRAKELSITQVQDELRLKEEDEIEFKRKQEAMHQKMEVDCQRCKDDVQRLEQEIYSLQLSLECAVPYHLPPVMISESQLERSRRDLLTTTLPDSSLLPDISMETYTRSCLMCMEKEPSIVFLPCAHQVLCTSCNNDHCRNVGYRCPCCQALISQTIWIYGTVQSVCRRLQ